MQVLYPRCCGIDIHKASITACVLVAEGKSKERYRLRCGTMTRDLLALADWLMGFGVTHVAMESTGVYWKPIWNVLEGRFELLLVNAQHFKAVPGRKTDVKDCEWLAELLQHGLVRSSFVPPTLVRDLRDLNRNRAILVQQRATVSNRIEKVLEDANIKLGVVASHVLGQSGRTMLHAMSTGEEDIDKLAEMAKAKLRKKIPELRVALFGKMRDHHRFLLRQWLSQLESVEKQIAEFDLEIDRRNEPFQQTVDRLTKGTYLSAQYHRLAARRGKKRAIIGIAHSILVIAYYLIARGEEYRDKGGDYFDRINCEGLKRYLIRRLEHLGHSVKLEPVPSEA